MQKPSHKSILKAFVLTLVVVFPLAFMLQAKKKPSGSSSGTASVAQGKELFHENCAMCHSATETKTKIGPGLKGLFKAKELPYSHRPVTVANVREQIEKGNPQGKPMPMPGFGGKLSPAQINDLIAYLKTL